MFGIRGWRSRKSSSKPVASTKPIGISMSSTPRSRPPLSQTTVSVMIQLFEFLMPEARGFYAAGPPLTEENLHDALFAMGVDKQVLDRCAFTYNWNFRHLLPALYDCTFFAQPAIARAESHGPGYLRAFATFLCGFYAQPEF